ncbi:MAG: hypothetical protein GX089_14320 [Fibrobacter sp.]|nr:hypothetical protein [Fibrobacter sp.]
MNISCGLYPKRRYRRTIRNLLIFFLSAVSFYVHEISAANFNSFGLKYYTVDTDHFRINYVDGCGHLAEPVANKLEELYKIYRDIYNLVLPNKTEVVILNGDVSNGWAFANSNTITIWAIDFDFNMRGSHNWINDVVTHEYAHVVSIWSSLKFPSQIIDFRLGFFSHPNEKGRVEAFHSIPNEILPAWFVEGIAQYESSRHGSDTWDSHRDMILRTLTLSDKILSWEHMQVFTGRSDDYEKAYNHGFSLVKYISETYGYEKVVSLLRESSKAARFNFDRSIKEVLGISSKKLYREWKNSLVVRYKGQIKEIGEQVYGRKISRDGFEHAWPRFSPDGSKVYFLSNGKNEYGRKQLCLFPVSDTVDTTGIRNPVFPTGGFYNIHPGSGKICYISNISKKSELPPKKGGVKVLDLFIDTLPSWKKDFKLFKKKTMRQVTEKQSVFSASFSPDGKHLAYSRRNVDRFYLALTDTAGKVQKILYPNPDSDSEQISFIYSIDWSPDGKSIAFSYFEKETRNIGIFDTLTRTCRILPDSGCDERDPVFSPDGKYLYYSSDRTGIFNIYRYDLQSGIIEQVTNVSGGAFQPSISPDGTRMAYTGYDKDGFGIYVIDTIKATGKSQTAVALNDRRVKVDTLKDVSMSAPRPYQWMPRQLLISPILMAEQLVTEKDNSQQGVTTVKMGAVFNLIEPLTLSGAGSEIGAFFFLEPKRLFDFIAPDQGGINTKANYDVGVFGVTQVLPLTLSFDYMLRGIADIDEFFDETEESVLELPYNMQLHNMNLLISHYFGGSYAELRNFLALSLLLGANIYNVNMNLEDLRDIGVFYYNLSKGFRIGAMGTMGFVVREPKMNISPRGLAAKLQYDFWRQNSLKEENSFDPNSSMPKELYDKYLFQQILGHAKMGIAAPWYGKHDLHFDMLGTYLNVLKQDQEQVLPSFYLPGTWIPGYAYYYRDQKIKHIDDQDTVMITEDTLVVTGKAVISAEASYRFPLWPGLIDKKIGFLYLERLYGCINVGAGAGWDRPQEFFQFNREDWLLYFGLEMRLEAITFSSYPLALKFRWDRGLDLAPPLGGNRFSFSLGYDFDNWSNILQPDYRKQFRLSNRY